MEWTSILDSLTDHAKECGLLLKLGDCDTEEKIIKSVRDSEKIRNNVHVYVEKRGEGVKLKSQKSLSKSDKLRKLGNDLFVKKKYKDSLQFYDDSICYAPHGSENLALALGNRSAALFYLKNYTDCLRDINLAINFGYPSSKVEKLTIRKTECLNELKASSEGNCQTLEKINSFTNNEKVCVESEATNLKIEVRNGANDMFDSASSCLKLESSYDQGRFVTATENLNQGDILFNEEPFAFLVLPDFQQIFCHNCCCKVTYRIPCWYCLDSLYCSEECRLEAYQSYHKIECGYLRLLNTVGIAHLALRVLVQNPDLKLLIKFYKGVINGCVNMDDKEKEILNKYSKVFHLVTNIKLLKVEDLFQYSVTAVMLTTFLKERSNLIEDLSEHEENIICCLLFHHVTQLVCNAHAITDATITGYADTHVANFTQERIATAIYPSASMMNHSCAPNIISSFYGKRLIVKCSESVAKGCEIFNCYGPYFRRMDTADRQDVLKNQYCFICTCGPCQKPRDFLERFRGFNCNKCQGPVVLVNQRETRLASCLDCKVQVRLTKKQLETEVIVEELLNDGLYLAEEVNDVVQAVEQLQSAWSYGDGVLYKHHDLMMVTADQLTKCLVILHCYTECFKYLTISVDGVREKFGACSVELGHELMKLVDVFLSQHGYEACLSDRRKSEKKVQSMLQTCKTAKEIFQLHYGPWHAFMNDIVTQENDLCLLLNSN